MGAHTVGAAKRRWFRLAVSVLRCSIISALSNNVVLYFKVFTGRFTVPVLLEFTGRMERQLERPLVLIFDGHPVHKAKVVREWLNNRKEHITQEFLPPYSPELNPANF